MSRYVSEEIRQRVREQAGNRCGYCRSPQHLVLGTLEIEHLAPRGRGGSAEEDNLWLACRLCNSFKADQVSGHDPETHGGLGRGGSLWSPPLGWGGLGRGGSLWSPPLGWGGLGRGGRNSELGGRRSVRRSGKGIAGKGIAGKRMVGQGNAGRGNGMLEWWSVGMLECWNVGMLE
jgi:hypothetical protein